jgi:lipopolysaccharide export system permease protein
MDIAIRARRSAPGFKLGLLDLYLLRLLVPPMTAAFLVMLAALLLYRVMELFYFLSESSEQYGLLVGLIGNLLPHYLGLAIPAAFFISMFMVVARLGENSEIDALMAGGVSLTRLSLPLLGVGVGVGLVSVVLLGFVQPTARYGFNHLLNQAQAAAWDARLSPGAIVSPGAGLTLTTEDTDLTGRRLRGVFVRRQLAGGREQLITARSATLAPSPDGRMVSAVLEDGRQYEDGEDGHPLVGRFDQLVVELPASAAPPPFRARDPARELTLTELLPRMRPGDPLRRPATSEFYTRVVRSISAPLLVYLALPLGVAAKRRRRSAGLVFAGLTLMLYEHAIDAGQGLADLGRATPELAIWGPFGLFALLCAWLYAGNHGQPGETPLTFAMEAVSEAAAFLRRAAGSLARPAAQGSRPTPDPAPLSPPVRRRP